jgi:hypothetical protein
MSGSTMLNSTLARLLDAPVTLEVQVLLVGDEVGEVLGVAQHDVDRLRELEVAGVDGLDLLLGQQDVVALPVDGVSGADLDREVTAAAARDADFVGVTRHDARRVERLVVELALFDVVALGVVPVLLGGQEALEEVDALVRSLSHRSLRVLRDAVAFAGDDADTPDATDADHEGLQLIRRGGRGEGQHVHRVHGFLHADDVVDLEDVVVGDVRVAGRHLDDEAVGEVHLGEHDRVQADADLADAEALVGEPVLHELRFDAGEDRQEDLQAAHGAAATRRSRWPCG